MSLGGSNGAPSELAGLRSATTAKTPTCVDLFCGCGGFSLGMERAGFQTLAAVDIDPHAVAVFRRNFPHVPHVLQKDLTGFHPGELDELLQGRDVDVLVGGPPCQGFSIARRRDGANHGPRLKEDPRRELYRRFLGFVGWFKPRVFVMENVRGIKTTAGGRYYARLLAEATELGYRVSTPEICAWRYGVPQKRVRLLIIGTRSDLPEFSLQTWSPPTHGDPPRTSASGHRHPAPGSSECPPVGLQPPVTLWEAIGDLPPLAAGAGMEDTDYDPDRRQEHLRRYGPRYLVEVLEIHRATRLTAHVARPHSERDLRDFARLREGESSAAAMRRGVNFEWPYSKDHFKDRYTRQSRDGLCSTIVAHLSRDGLMFIHPTQNRSLTPREAARVQSFPDWFEFPVSRTHQFRLIGNAVPPLAQRTETPHCIKKPAVESNHCGGRVSSSRLPSGIQITMPSRARVSRTRYLLRMNSRVAGFCTACQALPLNCRNSQPVLPQTKSPPQHTPVQSNSRPWHSNSVSATSKRFDERTSSGSARNHSTKGKAFRKPDDTSSPCARSRSAPELASSPHRRNPRVFWRSQLRPASSERVSRIGKSLTRPAI